MDARTIPPAPATDPVPHEAPSAALERAPAPLSDRALQALIEGTTEPVIVESGFAGWDRPWRALTGADWQALERGLGPGLRVATVETGTNRATALRYGLEVIPAVLVFLEGELVARYSGRVGAPEILAGIEGARRRARERAASVREIARAAPASTRETPAHWRFLLGGTGPSLAPAS
jgi:thioredoxin-like negative regulator of GroEL